MQISPFFNTPYLYPNVMPPQPNNFYTPVQMVPNFGGYYSQPINLIAQNMHYTTNNVISPPPMQTSKLAAMFTTTSNPMTAPSTSTTTSLDNAPLVSSKPITKTDSNVAQPLGVVDKYILLAELGQDHLYPVYLGASIYDSAENPNLVVLKAIPITDIKGSFDNEKNIYLLKSHKNLLQCTEIIKNARFFLNNSQKKPTEGSRPSIGDGFYHVLVLKYHSNGDFLDYVKKRKLDESVARFYFAQILDALEHLHSHGYCHRDLKVENILLDQNYELILTDFGHSVQYRDQKGERLFIERSSITTPGICPPEFHKGCGYRGIPMDIFALGKLLLIFVTGFNPFKTSKDTDINYSLILKGQWTAYWKMTQNWMKKKWIKNETLNKDLKSLLESMLHPDPSQRPSIQQIRESNWFKKTQPASLDEVRIAMIRAKNQS